MKFELEPDNRNCSDEELLHDLEKVAMELASSKLTKDKYQKYGRFSPATIQKRFGSWNKALELSGLNTAHRINIPKEELIEDLKNSAKIAGKESLTTTEYHQIGKFTSATFNKVFGNWAKALEAAELKPTSYKATATNEELFDNLANVWEAVGRQPKQKDFHPPLSTFSASSYTRRFGSWRQALEAFIQSLDSDDEVELKTENKEPPKKVKPLDQIVHKTSRNPTWRLRYLVMQRDNFTCQFCGASPAKDPAVKLHIDHIKPWSKGGETLLPNLQTLCEQCNIGKSDLASVGWGEV